MDERLLFVEGTFAAVKIGFVVPEISPFCTRFVVVAAFAAVIDIGVASAGLIDSVLHQIRFQTANPNLG